MYLSNKIASLLLIPFIFLILLIFNSLNNPPSVFAQTCTGSFTCCEEVDPYAGCVGIAGPFSCEGASSSSCTSGYPENYCSSRYINIFSNSCNWSGTDCSCGGCNVGYDCEFGSDPSDSGPATWNCDGSCCNRPGSCPGIGACLADGTTVSNRPGCSSGGPTSTPPPPTPPPTPTETPPPPVFGNARPRYGAPVYPFPCDEVAPEDSDFNDFEFHTFRPYQASPCNLGYEDLALFCGNDLIINDPRTVTKIFVPRIIPIPRYEGSYEYEGEPIGPACFTDADCDTGSDCIDGQCSPANCKDNGDGTETCWFYIERIREIAIDLEGAFLPIMGFTEPSVGSDDRPEQVINQYFQDEQNMSDARKVNEYVSWYMSGVINNPSEYGALDPDSEEDIYKVVNFPGVLRKLLSHRSQRDIIGSESDDGTIQEGYASRFSDAGIRHDQVIGCVWKAIPILVPISDWGKITECYGSRSLKNEIRLSGYYNDWYLPPEEEAGFSSFEEWWIAFKQWRGYRCFGVLGANLCIDDPTRPNYYGDLFFQIPMSSTEDRLGKSEIATYSIQPPLSSTFIILSTAILEQTPAVLYFAHMEEGSELAQILQGMFAYEGADLEAEPEDTVVSTSDFCDLRGIRSNPGDNLFAGEITATIQYEAMLSCTFVEEGSGISGDPYNGNLCRHFTTADCIPDVPGDYECAEYYGRFDCDPGFDCARDCRPLPSGETCDIAFPARCVPDDWGCGTEIIVDPALGPLCSGGRRCCDGYSRPLGSLPIPLTQDCVIPVQIALRTTTETPLADDVWKRLVANPVSVFRRIFPQIEDEEGRPITRLWDMPAATSVVYSGEGVIVAGNPASGRPANQAELYFPHIGGVHEYFLKCIQKTLRPEGFGEGCISGPEPLAGIIGSGECTPAGGLISAGRCEAGLGLCSPGNLEGYFRSAGCSNPGQKALEASIICNIESGANPVATNCSCLSGGTCDYSIGLFQINLLFHCAGRNGFDFNCQNLAASFCSITDQALVDSCTEKYYNADENIRYMIQISGCGTNWTPWRGSAGACGLL